MPPFLLILIISANNLFWLIFYVPMFMYHFFAAKETVPKETVKVGTLSTGFPL